MQMLALLVIADRADFGSVSVQTLEIASLACGNDPAEGTLLSENQRSAVHRADKKSGLAPPRCARRREVWAIEPGVKIGVGANGPGVA